MSQYYAAFVAGGVGFATGAAFGWTNGPISLVYDDFEVQALPKHAGTGPLTAWLWHSNLRFKVTADEYFIILSSLNFGATIASIPSGFLIDAIGRKYTLLLLTGPYILGWLIVLAATNATLLCIGRSVLGVAAAASSVAGPVYMIEIAQERVRGVVNGFYKLQMTLGILFIYILSAFLSTLSLIVTCLVVHLILFAPIFWIPETPTYLLWTDRYETAKASLIWLRGKKYDPTAEIDEIKANLAKLKAFDLSDLRPMGFLQSIRRYSSMKALFISFALVSFVQMSGVNLIVMSSIALLTYARGSHNAHLSTIVLGFVYCISTFISIIIVDRLGRRLLLLISSASITLLFIVLGSYFYFEKVIINSSLNSDWAPLTLLSLVLTMFSFGIGTVPWLLIGELFPADIKGPAASIATTVYWLVGGLVNVAAGYGLYMLGIGITFWIFAITQFFNFFFIYFLVPETLGKSFFEINEILSKK